MIDRLYDKNTDVALVVSDLPSTLLRAALEDDKLRLLSIDPVTRTKILAKYHFLKPSEIPPYTYWSQMGEDRAIQTVATDAILVTTENAIEDRRIEFIAESIVEHSRELGLEFTPQQIASRKQGLKLHEAAEAYYKDNGHLVSRASAWERFIDAIDDTLNAGWRVLTILVILAGVYQGSLVLRRDHTSNEIGRQVLGISIEASEPDSVRKLLRIRQEIQERVRRRWWRWGELNKPRWRYLHDLIEDRVEDAKENLANSLVGELRELAAYESLDQATRIEHYDLLKRRIWRHFGDGELDSPQREMLLKLLTETKQQGDQSKENRD